MGITENFDEFVAIYRHKKKDIDINKALVQILETESIKTKQDLEKFCKKDRSILYNRVQSISHTHWKILKDPRASIRAKYETILKGYKIHDKRIKYPTTNPTM